MVETHARPDWCVSAVCERRGYRGFLVTAVIAVTKLRDVLVGGFARVDQRL